MVNKTSKTVEDWVRSVQSSCAYIGWESIGSPKALVPICKYRKNTISKCVYKRCPKVLNKVINE